MADDQISELRALRAGGADQPVLATMVRAVQATLGVSAGDVDPQARFIDLGGDSLSALTFSRLLADIFGVEVPVGVMVDPTADLLAIAKYIERHRDSDGLRPTLASVHGAEQHRGPRRGTHFGQIHRRDLLNAAAIAAAAHRRRPDGAGHRGDRISRAIPLRGMAAATCRFRRHADLHRSRAGDAAQARQRIEAALATDAELLDVSGRWPTVTSRCSTVISASPISVWMVPPGSVWPTAST